MRYTEETLIPAVLTIMPAVPVGRLAERVGLRQSDNPRGDLRPRGGMREGQLLSRDSPSTPACMRRS